MGLLLFVSLAFALASPIPALALASPSPASNWLEAYWNRMTPHSPLPKILMQTHTATAKNIIAKNLRAILPANNCPDPNKEKYEDPGPTNAVSLSMARDEFFTEAYLLREGMEIVFPNSDLSHIEFLTRQEAESLPFSAEKLPQILTLFGLSENSEVAEILNNTLTDCQPVTQTNPSDNPICASSLESILDFVVSQLGHDARLYLSQTESNTPIGLRIASKEVVANDVLVCHKLRYPYSIYMCHSSQQTKAYRVELMEPNGGQKAIQIVICHGDTSTWNPGHPAFKVLRVEPGKATICHVTPIDTLVWG